MKGKRIAGALLSLCLLGGLSVPAAASGIPGDINGDGLVNSKDALTLFRAVSGGSESSADVNGDGLVNAVDAAHLFSYVSGEPVELAEPEQHFTFEGNLTGRTIAQTLGGDVIAALRLVTYTADGEENMIPFVDADGTPHSYGALEALQRWQEPGSRSVFGYPGAYTELTLRHKAEGYTLSIVVYYEYLGEIASVAPDGSSTILPADAGLELTVSSALVAQSGVSAGDKVTYTQTNGTVTSVKRAATYTAKYEGYSTEPFLGYTYTFLTLDGNTMAAAFGARRALAEGLTAGETYTFYLDSLGDILDAESAQSGGEYDTQTTSRTVEVNRGLGLFEARLTGGTYANGKALPDYLGDIHANLRGANGGYTLNPSVYFHNRFNKWDEESGESYSVGAENYKALRFEITPFAGESIQAAPQVTAQWSPIDSGNSPQELSVASVLRDGKVILTAELPEEERIRVQMELSLNGIKQSVTVYANSDSSYMEGEPVYCDSWEKALETLASGKNAYYAGSEDVTLTAPLTLNTRQFLTLEYASLTIADGGLLTMAPSSTLSLYGEESTFTIEAGGELLASVDSDEDEYGDSMLEISGQKFLIKAGGKLTLADDAYLYSWIENGGCAAENGAVITGGENSFLEIDCDAGSFQLDGSLTTKGSFYAITADDFIIGPMGFLSCAEEFSWNGSTFKNRGLLSFSGYWGTISGGFENEGTLRLGDYAELTLENSGYTVYNRGSMELGENAGLTVSGSVLNNSGSIGGEGTLRLLDEIRTDGYSTGIERIKYDRTRPYGPDNYNRRLFTAEPDKTVTEIRFYAAFKNSGSCSVNVN